MPVALLLLTIKNYNSTCRLLFFNALSETNVEIFNTTICMAITKHAPFGFVELISISFWSHATVFSNILLFDMLYISIRLRSSASIKFVTMMRIQLDQLHFWFDQKRSLLQHLATYRRPYSLAVTLQQGLLSVSPSFVSSVAAADPPPSIVEEPINPRRFRYWFMGRS